MDNPVNPISSAPSAPSRRRGRPPRTQERVEETVMEPVTAVPRAEMRSEVREEDSRSRAARRAAEIRGHIGDMDQGVDEFYVDPTIIPEGWTYEWKRLAILGQEDSTHQIHLARMGWEAVPARRHPGMMPASWSKATIERKGMILMERPTEVVEEARRIQNRAAKDQVRAKEAQIAGAPDGTMTRDHAQTRPKINKSFEAMPIPKE
jgi:hypothetical protein